MPKDPAPHEKLAERKGKVAPIGEVDAHRENQLEQQSGRNQDGTPLVKPR